MLIELHGDGLRLLEHLIHYSSLCPDRLAEAMGYDLDGFVHCLSHLDKALHDAVPVPTRKKTGSHKKAQPSLPSDFDFRFPEPVGAMIKEWLAYKTERKDFYSPTGLRNLLAQIDTYVVNDSPEAVVNLISECMANNWAGIIWDRIDRQGHRSQRLHDPRDRRRVASRQDNPWLGIFDDAD